jgi:hypothetical protein
MKRLLQSTILCLALTTVEPAFAGVQFYVSPHGSDAQPGTREKPFATLEAARDALRALKAKGEGLDGNATVNIEGGTYFRSQTFDLGPGDDDTRYLRIGDTAPRFIGGLVLRDFTPVTNAAVLERLEPAARTNVLVCDLRALGLTQLGQLRSRGFSRPTLPAHLELFFAGNPMTLARWPNEGDWARISGIPDSGAHKDEHGGQLGTLADGFFYSGDRPNRWRASDDIWVHGYWAWDWANSYERVATLDTTAHTIKTAPPYGLYGFRVGQRFCFLNVFEELDQPGEYYVDRASGLLYFWPPSPIATGEAIVSTLESPLISMRNVSSVELRGLILEGTRGLGVTISGGTNDSICGCAIRRIGTTGVSIEGGSAHGVIGCNIENTGDCGVSMSGGDRQALTPGKHRVVDTHFQKQGRWTKCYVPAILMSGVGLRAEHNLIHDHPHCAILFSGNDHLIEGNEIHHVALETGDVGAIYTGRDYTFRGNIIRRNYIHETGGVGMGSMGVYMDDCVSGTMIVSNVFYKVQRAAFLGGGRDHHVEYNTFVECDPAVEIDGRGLDKAPVWHNMVYDFMRKQMDAVPRELYRKRYPELATLDRYYEGDPGIPPEGNVVAHNICVGKWLNIQWHAEQKMMDIHENFVGSDPGFINPAKGNFGLNPESPLLKQGYPSNNREDIGLTDNPCRQEPALR